MKFTVYTISEKNNFTDEFLSLPQRLYGKNEIMQNTDDERALLEGKHVLSGYFSLAPFIAEDENGKCVCRCAAAVYPDDDTAFMGLFESENVPEAVKTMFDAAEEFLRAKGIKKIVGPVDGSFWIRYRFKTDRFGQPYTGEPYNLPYYAELWEKCGYRICERYSSNHYTAVKNQVDQEKFSKRLEEKISEGYLIKNVENRDFDKAIKEVYGMLIELYSGFPAYKRITENEFAALYGYFGKIMRSEMVKMAYFHGKPVGFLIGIPDYGNIIYGKMSAADYLKFFRIRRKPKGYVLLYMGVDQSHRGLGKALAESVRLELKGKGVPSVGALIRDGNCNKDYFYSLIDYEFHYVLLEKQL